MKTTSTISLLAVVLQFFFCAAAETVAELTEELIALTSWQENLESNGVVGLDDARLGSLFEFIADHCDQKFQNLKNTHEIEGMLWAPDVDDQSELTGTVRVTAWADAKSNSNNGKGKGPENYFIDAIVMDTGEEFRLEGLDPSYVCDGIYSSSSSKADDGDCSNQGGNLKGEGQDRRQLGRREGGRCGDKLKGRQCLSTADITIMEQIDGRIASGYWNCNNYQETPDHEYQLHEVALCCDDQYEPGDTDNEFTLYQGTENERKVYGKVGYHDYKETSQCVDYRGDKPESMTGEYVKDGVTFKQVLFHSSFKRTARPPSTPPSDDECPAFTTHLWQKKEGTECWKLICGRPDSRGKAFVEEDKNDIGGISCPKTGKPSGLWGCQDVTPPQCN